MSLLSLFLFLPFLAPSQASCANSDVESCQFLNPIESLPKLKKIPYLTIVVDDTVDIHEAALVFARLLCVIRLQSDDDLDSVWLASADQSRWFRYVEADPYEFFMRHFSKNVIPRKNLCETLNRSIGLRLIFSGLNSTYCPAKSKANHRHPKVNLLLGGWEKNHIIGYPNGSMVRTRAEWDDAWTNQLRINVSAENSIPSIYGVAYLLGGVPLNSSSVEGKLEKVKRNFMDDQETEKQAKKSPVRMIVGLFYLCGLLIAIFILFFSLLNLVNVNEHYLYVMHLLIRQRVRRQRAQMAADNGENGEGGVEEGEEAVERPNRRNRLNSEERSLLGTDENTIQTALTGRFSSLSSLSFHSADSQPRRASLESLVIDGSSEVRTSKPEKDNREDPKK